MIWKHSPLKCYNDKPLLAVFQTCETSKREGGREWEKGKETGTLLHSFSYSFSFCKVSENLWLVRREGEEKETVISKETHMVRK